MQYKQKCNNTLNALNDNKCKSRQEETIENYKILKRSQYKQSFKYVLNVNVIEK